MDRDIVIGITLLIGAVTFITITVLYSRNVIEKIARHDVKSAREIKRKLDE